MRPLATGAVAFVARAPQSAAWRIATTVAHAWHGITLRQWIAASVIGFAYFLLFLVSILPQVAGAVVNLGESKAWGLQSFVGTALMCFAGAYCFLLAVRVAEFDSAAGIAKPHRYVIAGVAAVAGAFPVLVAVSVLLHPCACTNDDALMSSIRTAVFHANDLTLTGGLALAVYVRLKSARAAREAFQAAELDRLAVAREVIASRLAVMRARVEPQFLLSTLMQVEGLYDRKPSAAASMLESLIAYLHAALPQLRRDSSTLGCEVELARRYLDVVRARMGKRLEFDVRISGELSEEEFPPLVILPAVEDALVNGLGPLPLGGKIEVFARLNGRYLSVSVVDDGLTREANEAVAGLAARLRGLYGNEARVVSEPNAPCGVIVTVEIPHAAGDHR